MNRRTLFRNALIGGGAVAALPVSRALAETPSQPEGPFHPANLDTDLLRRGPGRPLATGQVIHVTGRVTDDRTGRAIAGVQVELWQADHQGKYSHPADPLELTPDENFQFWGRAITNATGGFSFRTIKPGAYPASPTWMRPPHLHFRFIRRGYHELTTQMYFAGESLNGADLLLAEVPSNERSKVVVNFSESNLESKPGVRDLVGQFDIELRPVA